MDIEPQAPRPRHVHGYWRRHSAAWLRWLHIYLSMASFAILLFFAVTGLTLNHAEWFTAGQSSTRHGQGTLNADWVKTPDDKVAKLEIVEFLRQTHHIKGAAAEFVVDDDRCSVTFKGPGYAADVFIERATGNYELTEDRLGWVAVFNDLHKGRDSGRGWSLLIDASAVVMTVVSLSGLALIFFLRRRLVVGLVVAVAGAVASVAIYLFVVP